jgi:ethanolamine utilization protein EutN
MKLARVLGTVVASQKYQDLEGIKFLVVQPLDEDLQPNGLAQVAADATAQAAPGELVFMVASREAAQALPETFVPVDLAITGIVDEVHAPKEARSSRGTARWRRVGEASGPQNESDQ